MHDKTKTDLRMHKDKIIIAFQRKPRQTVTRNMYCRGASIQDGQASTSA